MVGLTFTPPLIPAVQLGRAAGGDPQPLILSVLSGTAPGAIGDSLADTLAITTGPGNIVSGKVASAVAGGNFTLETSTGAELTLHHPPELPITVGSSVTLRIVTTGLTPQATILSVDGRSLIQSGAAPPPPTPAAQTPPPVAAAAIPAASGNAPLPGSGSASAYAASLAAQLAADADLLAETDLATDAEAPSADPPASSTLGPLTAILVRPAAVAFGQQPLAVGTRYLLALTEGSDDAADDQAAWPEPDAADEPDFVAQTAKIAGRVMPSAKFGELVVQTGLGTLALPTDTNVAVGTAVRLWIGGVGPPLANPAAPTPTDTAGLLDQAIAVLIASAPSTAKQALDLLMLPPSGALMAQAWKFMGDGKTRIATKDAVGQIRRMLAEAGRPDLADRLQASAQTLGELRPQRVSDGWMMTVLPFLGPASQEPVRLYVRGDDERDDDPEHDHGERMIIEVKLRRLGPVQFEALARERRLDMMVRTSAALDPPLIGVIEGAFREAVEACGFAGEINFGRIAHFPLALPTPAAPVMAVDA